MTGTARKGGVGHRRAASYCQVLHGPERCSPSECVLKVPRCGCRSIEAPDGAGEDVDPLMKSFCTVTLFSEQPDLSHRPSSVVVSLLVHGAALGLLYSGILHAPGISRRVLSTRYTLRQLDLLLAEPRMAHSASMKSGEQAPAPGDGQDVSRAILEQIAEMTPGRQTLLQPELPANLPALAETPVPQVVIWTAQKTEARTIVLPSPHEATGADVRPSLDAPNEELNLADASIASSDHTARMLTLPASTTSPIIARRPELVQMVPVTTSNSSEQPTPAAVISLSDLRMREGTVTLPPVNRTAAAPSPGALGPSRTGQPSPAGASNRTGHAGEMGAGQGAGDSKDRPTGFHDAVAKAGSQGNENGKGPGSEPSSERFLLAKDGKFGVVVVGSSIEEKYPETAELWAGRLAYTVYLRVGLAKSWILQYSVPRAADAAMAGNVAHLEAPWPYCIVRPNIASGAIDADALMVHGFVNQSGRFESLAIAFPEEFAQASLVLDALRQWQFRPAMQNGQIARVEVLLIIPEVPQ